MKDTQFAAALQEMEPEFQAAKEVLGLRLAQGLTQEELTKRISAKHASISRLERASYKPNLGFLQRVAKARNARGEIRFVPREQAYSRSPTGRQSAAAPPTAPTTADGRSRRATCAVAAPALRATPADARPTASPLAARAM